MVKATFLGLRLLVLLMIYERGTTWTFGECMDEPIVAAGAARLNFKVG